jgi:hypothetical protein
VWLCEMIITFGWGSERIGVFFFILFFFLRFLILVFQEYPFVLDTFQREAIKCLERNEVSQ